MKTVQKPLSLLVHIDRGLEIDELFQLRDEASAWCKKAQQGKKSVLEGADRNNLSIIIEVDKIKPGVIDGVKGALECVDMVGAKVDIVVTGPEQLQQELLETSSSFKFYSNESIAETGSGLITRTGGDHQVVFEGTGGAGDSIADATLFLEKLVSGIQNKYDEIASSSVKLDRVDLEGAKDVAPAVRGIVKFQSAMVRGEIGISFSENAFLKVASAMLERPLKRLDQKLLDGAAELLNIFVSATKSDLNSKMYGFQLERPAVLSEFEMFKWMKEHHPVKMTFRSGAEEQFFVYLKCEPQPKFSELAVEVLKAA